MTSITQATSGTVTAILGSVATVAHTAQGAVQTIASGLHMLDNYVADARVKQTDASAINMSLYRTNLIADASKDQEKRITELHREYAQDPVRAARFNDITAKLEALFAAPTPTP